MTSEGSVAGPSRTTNPQPKNKAVPIRIDGETYAKLRSYADLTGIPVSRVAAQALGDWLETVGAARFEALQKYAKGERKLTPEDLTPTPEYTPADAMEEKVVLDGTTPQN